MTDTDKPTTSETIIASAGADTAPGTLSAASETEASWVQQPPLPDSATVGPLVNMNDLVSQLGLAPPVDANNADANKPIVSDTDAPEANNDVSADVSTNYKLLSDYASPEQTLDINLTDENPAVSDARTMPHWRDVVAGGHQIVMEGHESRIQRLEDEIAYLRKMFGWPEKGE